MTRRLRHSWAAFPRAASSSLRTLTPPSLAQFPAPRTRRKIRIRKSPTPSLITRMSQRVAPAAGAAETGIKRISRTSTRSHLVGYSTPLMVLRRPRAAFSLRMCLQCPVIWDLQLIIRHHYSTTNHLDQLDPALCRPGRMDVWIEFKNASKYQAENLFRNFFPSADADPSPTPDSDDIDPLEMPAPSSPANSQLSSLFSDALSGISSVSSRSGSLSPLSSPTPTGSRRSESICSRAGAKSEISEISSAVEEHVAACAHAVPPLSAARLAQLGKQFADAIPDEGFSVAALQGCEYSDFFGMWLDHC